MGRDLEMGDWTAIVEVCDVGLGVELFLRDVAVVGGFEPNAVVVVVVSSV